MTLLNADCPSDDKALWSRLEAHSLDEPDAAVPFSVRLAAENGWSLEFAQRAIREYKRFAFLAATSTETMTPSDEVDQVWHLHLTYTRSYWDEFCPQVLHFKLHHEPSWGGPSEEHKYLLTYQATLERYRSSFGHAPPDDLWPSPELRFGRRFRRIRVSHGSRLRQAWDRVWSVGRAHSFTALTTFSAALLAGCNGVFTDKIASSQDAAAFLNFYLALCLVGLSLSLWRRHRLLAATSGQKPAQPGDLHVYELAYLARGRGGVLQTVIATLFQLGKLKPTTGGSFAMLGVLDGSSDRLERAFAADLRRGKIPPGGGRAFFAALENMKLGLEDKGLVHSRAELAQVRRWVNPIVLGILAVGAIRAVYGALHHHPIGFLLLMMFIYFLGSLLAYRRPRANLAGIQVVQAAKQSAQIPEKIDQIDPRIPLAVALLGTGILAGPALDDVRKGMDGVMPGNGSGGSDGGSGCGGGGGGCGGGGCGG